jgi:hypothetical protein
MYDNVYSIIGLDKFIYTDTDSCKFRASDSKAFIDYASNQIVPHWPEVEEFDERYKIHKMYSPDSKVFGSFEDELADYNPSSKYLFYCVQKKACLYITDNNMKMTFKGIRDNSVLLDLNEPFVKVIFHKSGEKSYELTDYAAAYDYYNKNITGTVEQRAEEFYERVYKIGEAFVLCESFQKKTGNTKRNVTIDDTGKFNKMMNMIEDKFVIKHLKLKNTIDNYILGTVE